MTSFRTMPFSTNQVDMTSQEHYPHNRREGFFRPNSLPIVATYLIIMFIIALIRSNTSPDRNTWIGHLSVVIFIIIVGVLVLPNSPLIRPHPALWRLVDALSLVYLMTLLYVMFQNLETVKAIMFWFFPRLVAVTDVFETPYDMNCTDYSLQNLFSKTDVYTFGHFFGWVAKAMLVRHYGMCWLLSITWEVTELAFDHLLPFAECWWDSIVLDVIATNGLGIVTGMLLLKLFRIETYDWDGFEDQTSNVEIRETLLHLSSGVSVMDTFDQFDTYVRVLAISVFNIFWQITELNTFFQMKIFDIPADHPIMLGRLALIGMMVAPLVTEYLAYIKQSQITGFSYRLWIFCTIIIFEAMVNIKYEPKIMANLRPWNYILWLIIQLFFCIVCHASSIYWKTYRSRTAVPETCIEKI